MSSCLECELARGSILRSVIYLCTNDHLQVQPGTPSHSQTCFDTMAQIATVNIQLTNKTIRVPTGLFINNEFVPSVDSTDLLQFVKNLSTK